MINYANTCLACNNELTNITWVIVNRIYKSMRSDVSNFLEKNEFIFSLANFKSSFQKVIQIICPFL